MFTHKQRVTVKTKETWITDAMISVDENNKLWVYNNVCGYTNYKIDNLGYKYAFCIWSGSLLDLINASISHLKPINEDIENVYVGAIIENERCKRKVLAICDDAVGVSYGREFDVFDNWFTIKELKDDGFKIIIPDELKPAKKDKDVEDAINLLERKGKIKDGKIIV